MAESETSSSILSTWLAPEQQFEKVVLWPTPKAGSGLRPRCSGVRGVGDVGRPGIVAPKQQLQYTIYSISSTAETAVQQLFDTTHAERWSAD